MGRVGEWERWRLVIKSCPEIGLQKGCLVLKRVYRKVLEAAVLLRKIGSDLFYYV